MRNSNGRRAPRRLTTALPDGRVYEMVSPVDKGGYEISASARGGWGWAGTTGDRMIYGLYANVEGNPSGMLSLSPLKATRTPQGWRTTGLLPQPVSDSPLPLWIGAGNVELPTADLAQVTVTSTLPAAPGAANARWNLFDQGDDGAFSLLLPRLTDNYGDFNSTLVVSRSDDGDHVVVDSFNQLTPDAPAGVENLFELVDGRARMVGIRPDGTPFAGGVTSPSPGGDSATTLPFQNAISADGSRIVFLDPSDSHLYVRIDGERTVALPELPVGALTNGRQTFYYATPDGGKIAFTNGTNTNLGVPYLYDVATNTATNLIDGLGGPATPISSIIALSDDGRYVYFGGNQIASTGAPIGRSIYVWHDGTVRYVGPLTPVSGGSDRPAARTSFASADGSAFVFQTTAAVPGFPATSPATLRVFRYDAVSGGIDCVSCLPDGTASGMDADAGMVAFGIFKMFSNRLQSSISDDGSRVFFQTAARLLPADENDRFDVYQWHDGELSLISTGRSTSDSYFGDASADGDDVFFFTREPLAPEDSDDAMDLYDARVGGGLPSRVPPDPDRSCAADGCQGPATGRPGVTTPGSEIAPSDGNVADPIAPAEPVPFELYVTAPGKQASARLAKRGALTVRFEVNRATKATLRLQVRRGGRWVAAGSAKHAVRRAGATTATVRLAAKARKQLARTRKLTVRIEVRAGGVVRRQQLTVKVKAAAHKKGNGNG